MRLLLVEDDCKLAEFVARGLRPNASPSIWPPTIAKACIVSNPSPMIC
jgi:hypothetical protein